MKPIIGIILRNSKSNENNDIKYLYTDLENAIIKSGGIPIGITNDIDKYLDICNGFILQGGDDIDTDNLKAIDLIREKDIPLLGICLGMQEMGLRNVNLCDIEGHKNNILHEININKDSLLYKIIGTPKTLVNSRHKSAIKETKYKVNAISNDNVIEAIEDDTKRFFLGIQWHPESLYTNDLNSRKIFDYFIKMCHYK